jgi:hypothetical protein
MKLRSASDQDLTPEGPLYSGLASSEQSHAHYYFPTTPGERFLLFTTALIIPLETHIRLLPNFSIMFLMFGVLAGYVAINRLQCLDRIWMHPVLVCAYVFIGISAAIEFANPLSRFNVIGQFALMIAGASCVASLCRDRAALKMLLYGIIGAALWLGVLLFLTSYGTLSSTVTTNYNEADLARNEAFKDSPLQGNLNRFANSCVQGGVVALAFALGSASVRRRNVFTLMAIFCLVVSTLPMSRQAIVIDLAACTVMLKAYGIRKGKVWLLVGLIAASVVFIVPDALWSRMMVETDKSNKDARVYFYEHAIKDIDDYWFMGVGEGNYFQKWGFQKGYGHSNGETIVVYGVHNTFLQVIIFWGVIALLLFLVIIWQAYRCIPKRFGSDPLALSLLGLAVSVFLGLFFSHSLENKIFSLTLGMLVAHQRWLTQNNVASPQCDN